MTSVRKEPISFTSYFTGTAMTFPTALENLNILAQRTLPPPSQLHLDIAASAAATHNVNTARAALTEILSGRDQRLIERASLGHDQHQGVHRARRAGIGQFDVHAPYT